MSFSPSFKAFGGKLDHSFFDLSFDLNRAVLLVAKWIDGLRASPEHYGIPKERTQDVINLLDRFFPEPPEDHPIEPLRISTDVGFRDSLRKIVPVTVTFGPWDGTILIADATNALAYIFAIATPSVSQPTFTNYHLPLTVLYAWFIYLLFLSPASSPTFVITNIPSDVCVLYLSGITIAPSSSRAVFCSGATWSGADPADPYGSEMVSNSEVANDEWRSMVYTNPAFARNPAALVPPSLPRARVQAVRRLNEYILGKQANDSNVTPFLDPLFTGVLPGGDKVGLTEFILATSVTIIAEAKQPGIPTVPDFLVSHTKLSPKLMSLLYAVLDASKDLSDTVRLLPAFSALIEFYITPHVFRSFWQD